MGRKIFKSICAATLACVLVCVALITGIVYSYFTDRMLSELAAETSYLSRALVQMDYDYDWLENFRQDEKRITLIASDGSVLYDNRADAETMENHAGRKEVADALQSGAGSAMRTSDTLTKRTLYYARRLPDGNVLRIAATQHSILMLAIGILQPITVAVVITLLIAWYAASRTAKRLVAPINAIDPEHCRDSVTYPELSPLINKIDRQNRQIAQQLAEAQRQSRDMTLILSNMQEGIVMLDVQNRIVLVNEAAKKLLGSPIKTGEHALTINRSAAFRRLMETIAAGTQAREQLACDGRTCQVTAAPVRGKQDELLGSVLLIVDVTEQTQRQHLRSSFTANVSHELMTPVTAICGYAQLLHAQATTQDVRDFADRILEKGKHLAHIVDEALTLLALEDTHTATQMQRINAFVQAKEAISAIQQKACGDGVTVSLEGDESAMIEADAQILQKLLGVLLDNAVRYNHAGGNVHVRISQEKGNTCIAICDNGTGIEKQKQQYVFERFYRADESHHACDAAGLGLAVAKHAAQALHAQLTLQSEPGKGTCICILFLSDVPCRNES